MQLQDRVALITGASAGIGQAVARQLADRGARVLVHGRDLDRTAAVAAAVGGTALVADLTDRRERDRLATDAIATHGRIDVLVNNAGAGWCGPFPSMARDRLRAVLELDLTAGIELTHALLPDMLTRGSGSVCFVGSVAGAHRVAGEAVYAAAKAGVDLFAESLRAELAGSGVHVGVVVPAVVRTGFFDTRDRPLDRRRPRPLAPDAVAAAVIRTIEDEKAEVWAPAWLRVAPAVRAVAPGAYRRLALRFGEQIRVRVRGSS